jgi:hypothetical protein
MPTAVAVVEVDIHPVDIHAGTQEGVHLAIPVDTLLVRQQARLPIRPAMAK